MSFILEFTQQAQNDIDKHKQSGNKIIIKKIFVLFEAISLNTYDGLGKPEQLKHHLSGYWSRRINKEHRIVYRISEDKVYINSAFGHYF